MRTSHRFLVADESQVGEARRAVADICGREGIDETSAGKLAITVTELGRNLVRHASGGEIFVREIPADPTFGIEVLSIDRGPGIANLAEAFRDGFSTAGTSGTGLGAVKRLADRFDVFSHRGKGTVVSSYIGFPSPATCHFEVGAISTPLRGETLCGDGWDFEEAGDGARFLVADGLGHGPFAEEAAREAISVFRAHSKSAPSTTLGFMHLALAKTRGAAGAMVNIDLASRRLTSAGVGNISMRTIGEGLTKSLVSDNGTLGANARQVRDATVSWEKGALLVMHSDGIGTQWNLGDYPGAINRHPSIVAALIYRDYRRERDDATVVVIREK